MLFYHMYGIIGGYFVFSPPGSDIGKIYMLTAVALLLFYEVYLALCQMCCVRVGVLNFPAFACYYC